MPQTFNAARAPDAPAFAPVPSFGLDATLNDAANLLRQGRKAEVLSALATLDPNMISSPDRCHLAGLIHVGAEAWAGAVPWFAQARKLRPDFVDAIVRLARVLQRLGRFEEAAAAFDEAEKFGVSDPSVYYNKGLVLHALGRNGQAITAFDHALRLQPAYPEALRAGAIILSQSGNFDGALKFLEEALRLKPDYFEALLDRANILNALKRVDAACEAYRTALARFPGNPDLLNNLGVALIETGDLKGALEALDQAVAIKPELVEAWLNRATVLMKTVGPDAALQSFDRALALRPDYQAALVGRGVALKELEEFDAAEVAFDAALALDPESAHARNNKGVLQLLRGNFRDGLENYEYRWGCGLTPHNQLKFPIPQWQGNSHPGEKLIVYGGEGLGDALQFCRYLPLLAKAGIDVTFFCRSKLLRLMRGLIPQVRCVDDLGPYERFDSQIALSSLPFAFRTDLTTIPSCTPYLAAEPALVSKWAERLMSRGNSAAFKIGLCWQGNLDPKADPSRSIPLAHFAPLAGTKNFRLISLQKGEGAAALAAVPELAIEMLGADFDAGPDAFIDTAAVMQTLDLIITCDTSVAHLAGALGRPTFLLLRKVPDWRWMLDREDTPWYATMRLFRQRTRGDWDETMLRVVDVAKALHDYNSGLQTLRSAAMM
ncbi:MAG: tetratricopeptide repeat protein [Methylovirgula sp.]|uniref:tetratricopeptide repeat protein n=1 Tax=Methylovirgula sp. TaxID=1978224 RepID=UPI0030765E64